MNEIHVVCKVLPKIWFDIFLVSVIWLKACTRRIEKDDSGEKHCTGQYFDYWSCIDTCVSKLLLFLLSLDLLHKQSKFY